MSEPKPRLANFAGDCYVEDGDCMTFEVALHYAPRS
jgi:hypothetical protein